MTSDDAIRYAIFSLVVSAVLHVLGFILAGFVFESVFLLFPATLYSLLSVGLFRNMTWVAWVTLVCMVGGIFGTLIEFSGQLMAPALILIGIIFADLLTAGLLARWLWHGRERHDAG